MVKRKRYGQFCALARGLDVVGDRWTLLDVRELLIEPRSFRELQEALSHISPNLLTARLRTLTEDGLVVRNEAPSRSKAVRYSLTETGRSLEPVVLEMIRWGARWMGTGPGDDQVDPAWAALALRALLEGPVVAPVDAVVHLDVEGMPLSVVVADGSRRLERGHGAHPSARVSASMPDVLAVASGQAEPQAALRIEGDAAAASVALSPEGGSG